MPNLDYLFASRFLKARKKNKLLSFLSVSSVVGIMLGVTTLILVVSVMDGFTENLKKKFLGTNPHIVISYADGGGIENWESLLSELESYPNVSQVSPFILSQAMLSNERRVAGVVVKGLDPKLEKDAGGLPDTVILGNFYDLEERDDTLPPILLGKELMFSMGANLGNEITLISPAGSMGAFGMVPRMKKFRVAGLFDTGMYEHNRSLAYIHLKDARQFFRMGESINGIGVITRDSNTATKTAQKIQAGLNSKYLKKYWVRDWLTMNISLFSALKLEEYAMFIVLTLITIVASFNIVSMITVTVKDKRKEIAILRAMGAKEELIEKVFVKQGMLIGFAGTVLGNILSLIIAFVLSHTRIITVPKEIYYSDTVPLLLSPAVFLVVSVCALAITYAAAKIPARLSARQNPLEAIRND